jgi:uncharacterized protein (TIGR02001 family)
VLRRSIAVVGALALGVVTDATAQLSASVSLLSDYRFRGVSFSSEQPAAQADLNYDAASGWFAGAFVSSVKFDFYRNVDRLALGYAGYAYRIGPEASVDGSVSYADLSGGNNYDYLELHAGLTARLINVRVAYAPKYFGQDRAGTYVEANTGAQLTEMLRLFGHVGVLYVRPEPYRPGPKTQFDGRIGLRYEYQSFSAQLSRVQVSRIQGYPVESSQRRGTWVLQVTKFF